MALTLLHEDNFNRADDADLNGDSMSDAVGVWAVAGGVAAIVSNEGKATTGNDAGVYDSAMSAVGDQAAQAVVQSGDTGILCRHSAGGNNTYYLAYRDGGTIKVYRRESGGGFTEIASGGSFTLGSTLKIEAIGTAIKAYIDGVETASATDATYATGKAGWYGGGGNASRIDDFKDYVDAGGSTPGAGLVNGGLVNRGLVNGGLVA